MFEKGTQTQQQVEEGVLEEGPHVFVPRASCFVGLCLVVAVVSVELVVKLHRFGLFADESFQVRVSVFRWGGTMGRSGGDSPIDDSKEDERLVMRCRCR